MDEDQIGRKKHVMLNTFWIIFCQSVIALLGIVNRKVFLDALGSELLGVNSLFSDVLMLFSFADLGIGVAITFTLYKPIADNDRERVRSLLHFYKTIYRVVILLLVAISVFFIPFLKYLKTDIPYSELIIYYALFQFNNIVGYLFAYRETYVIARQRERELTIINFILNLTKLGIQITSLFLGISFLAYLLIGSAFAIITKIVLNIFIVRRYPETMLNDADQLSTEDKKEIFGKSKAMLVHRVGNLVINQTDSLIVSYAISVVKWGLVSNYLVIKSVVTTVLSKFYSAILPSFGDMIARDTKERQIHIFYTYDFLNFWIYYFCFIALAVLSTPFVSLYFGNDYILDFSSVTFLFLAFFMDGLRSPVSVFREASGAYEKDKWFTIIAAVVNLVGSIVLVHIVDLIGIYIGTTMAMFVMIFSRTIILFKHQLGVSSKKYLVSLCLKILVAIAGLGITYLICNALQNVMRVTVLSFIIMIIIVMIVPNLFLLILYSRSIYLKELLSLIKLKGGKK